MQYKYINIGAANFKWKIDGEAMRIISQHNLLLTEDWLLYTEHDTCSQLFYLLNSSY